VFEPLVCCLKAICVHLYTLSPDRFAPNLGIQVCLWIVNDVITSWLRLRSTSYHFPHQHLIHLRPLQTSILDIYKVFEPLVCCLKGIWVHLYTVKPAKFAPDLAFLGHLWSRNDVITSWLTLRSSTSNCFPHQHVIYTMCLSHWYAVSMAFGCTLILLHHRPS